MQPQAVSVRPQTSRQARRAYQKACSAPRLSAVELRQLERSAELQERAARIRAKDDRAKENKRKKAEKLERERAARKRMGIPEPTKSKIGSSQLSLNAFVVAGRKRKREGVSCPAQSLDTCREPGDMSSDKGTSKQLELTPKSLEELPKISPTETIIAPQTKRSPRKEEKATNAMAASLMPPPPARTPLREVSGNSMVQRGFHSGKCAMTNSIGTDWDSIFVSNTQVEREISGAQEKPSAPVLYKNVTPHTGLCHPVTDPADLLTDLSTQDLQYTLSPPPTIKDNPYGNLSVGHSGRGERPKASSQHSWKRTVAQNPKANPQFLLPSEESASPPRKRKLTSPLRGEELDVIIVVLVNRYRVWPSRPDIRRLISGHRLNGLAGVIPPWQVTNMAVKLEELREKGEILWTPNKLKQWASKTEPIEIRVRQKASAQFAAAALANLKKEAVAGGLLGANGRLVKQPFTDSTKADPTISRQNPQSLDTRAIHKGEEATASKSFDEFDEFEVSSQDLRELNI
ncbi:MAG: hypothetical protein LQ338_001903 [Usnochroma carphineum]|nr:MAG: hypothetical protein LQ338_001903 [Usnochroma carphineum]